MCTYTYLKLLLLLLQCLSLPVEAPGSMVWCSALQQDAAIGQRTQKLREGSSLSLISRSTACCYTAPWNKNKGVFPPSADWKPSTAAAAVTFYH